MITLTKAEQATLRKKLYNIVSNISEYHEDLIPRKNASLCSLMESYFYWADEYNDHYFPLTQYKPEGKLDAYLIQEWNIYNGIYEED